MALYHKDIRLPEGFRLPCRVVTLEYSRHAQRAADDDRYGMIPVLPILNLGLCEVIEVEIAGRRVEKMVLRTGLDAHNDVVVVVIPKTPNHYFVKTVWINEKNDDHKTLDRSRYVG